MATLKPYQFWFQFTETNDSIHPDKVWHITELTNTAEFGELIQIVNSLSGYDYHLKFKNAEGDLFSWNAQKYVYFLHKNATK